MRWFLTGMTALVLALVVGGAAEACGCCGGCKAGAGSCPSCPKGPAGGSCPNCPGQTASFQPSRYWSSAYGCYLYYDPATRVSYYWSEPHRAYYPVRSEPATNSTPPGSAAPSGSPGSTTYATRYYSPAP